MADNNRMPAKRRAFLFGCHFEDATREEVDALMEEFGGRVDKWQKKGVKNDERLTFKSVEDTVLLLTQRFLKLRTEREREARRRSAENGTAVDNQILHMIGGDAK